MALSTDCLHLWCGSAVSPAPSRFCWPAEPAAVHPTPCAPECLVSGFKDTSCICRYLTGGLIRDCSFCLKSKGGLQREALNLQGNTDGSTFCLSKTALLKGLRSLKCSAPNFFLGAKVTQAISSSSPRAPCWILGVSDQVSNYLSFCSIGLTATAPYLGVSKLATGRAFLKLTFNCTRSSLLFFFSLPFKDEGVQGKSKTPWGTTHWPIPYSHTLPRTPVCVG